MDANEISAYYRKIFDEDGVDNPHAISTLKTLIEFLVRDQSTTAVGLRENVRQAIETLKRTEPLVVVESVAEIFFRFITLDIAKYENFSDLKSALIQRSNEFLNKKVNPAIGRVAKYGHSFVPDGSVVLVHARSRNVFSTLAEAAKSKRFSVLITESAPDYSGRIMKKWLDQCSIPNQIIMDSSIGYYMEQVDLVMVGAEGVVESGGIINKIGTFSLAVLARTMNKPFYVIAETYKFVRIYPLNQRDIPDRLKYRETGTKKEVNVQVDYTPPEYITLLLTELGPLTTAAVSDELMKLYL